MAKSLTIRSETFLEEEDEVAEDRGRRWEESAGRRWRWEVSFWSVEIAILGGGGERGFERMFSSVGRLELFLFSAIWFG